MTKDNLGRYVLLLIFLGGAFFWLISGWFKRDFIDGPRHNAYKAEFVGQTVHTIRVGQILALPGKQPIRYGGVQTGQPGHIILLPDSRQGEASFKPPAQKIYSLPRKIKDFWGDISYGDINLAELGILATMHVLSATDKSYEKNIQYVITSHE